MDFHHLLLAGLPAHTHPTSCGIVFDPPNTRPWGGWRSAIRHSLENPAPLVRHARPAIRIRHSPALTKERTRWKNFLTSFSLTCAWSSSAPPLDSGPPSTPPSMFRLSGKRCGVIGDRRKRLRWAGSFLKTISQLFSCWPRHPAPQRVIGQCSCGENSRIRYRVGGLANGSRERALDDKLRVIRPFVFAVTAGYGSAQPALKGVTSRTSLQTTAWPVPVLLV